MNIAKRLTALTASLIIAIGLAFTVAAPAEASTRLGGIDVTQACIDQWGWYWGEAYLRNNNAYGWTCRHMEIVCFSWACGPYYSYIGGIDMSAACRSQYHRWNAYAHLDQNNARGWQCYV